MSIPGRCLSICIFRIQGTIARSAQGVFALIVTERPAGSGGPVAPGHRLPRGITVRIVAAGAIYVGGAIGVEMIGAPWAEIYGYFHTIPALFAICEEAMEMVGIIVFIDALLRYLKASGARSEIRLRFR